MENNPLDVFQANMNGILSVFERLNSKTNHVCHYECKYLPKTDALSTEHLLQQEWVETAESMQLVPITIAEKYVIHSFQYWLFRFLSKDETYYMIDKGNDFLFSDLDEQKNYAQEIVKWLFEKIEPQNSYKLTIKTKPKMFFACEYECFVFENIHAVFFVLFSWND